MCSPDTPAQPDSRPSLRRPYRVAVVGAALMLACALAPGGARGANDSPGSEYRAALERSQAAIGRPLADIALRDSTGRAVRLSDYRGKPLLVSMIYTGCFDVCPLTTQSLAKSVRLAREALGVDRFMVASIGFNQPFDNPVAMSAFARQSRIDDSHWVFLSPAPDQLAALVASLGFSYAATSRGFDHLVQLTLVDRDGIVYRQVYGDDFGAPMLIQPLKELLSGQASQGASIENLWERVKLYCTVYDPFTGAYRVNYSLFVEIFAGLTVLGLLGGVIVRELVRSRAP